MIDGKPLVVGAHSKDPEARCGCVSEGHFARGYKAHALVDSSAAVEGCTVTRTYPKTIPGCPTPDYNNVFPWCFRICDVRS